jgi:hypothetical protein
MRILWLILLTMRFCAGVARASDVLDVCHAATMKSARLMSVRGTGEIGKDGLVIGDVTCPVARSSDLSIPALIAIEVRSFDSGAIESEFRRLETNEANSALVQVLARGDLKCVSSFLTRRNETGEILSGNGYGTNGLIKCKLLAARLVALQEVHGSPPGHELK